MAYLEGFAEQEKNLLVMLPYRVGMWISESDSTGDHHADKHEQEALARIIEEKGKGMFESAFVHEVMAESWTQKDGWANWAETLDKVPDECRQAVSLIEGKLGERDVEAYKQNILQIAVKVAKAFGEGAHDDALPVKIWGAIRKKCGLFGAEAEVSLNISEEENKALAELSKALTSPNLTESTKDAAPQGN